MAEKKTSAELHIEYRSNLFIKKRVVPCLVRRKRLFVSLLSLARWKSLNDVYV